MLVNLASVAFAALALWSVFVLVRRDGARWPAWAMLVLAANSWFWIAATSLGDFVWALGLVLAGAVVAQRHPLAAGVLFGLAIGCRASSRCSCSRGSSRRSRATRMSVRQAATGPLAVVALAVGVVCFIPPWLDAGRPSASSTTSSSSSASGSTSGGGR